MTPSSPTPTVRYEVDGAVARITMARPEKRNAQDMTLIAELDDAFRRADQDPSVHVAVLAGEGPSFSAGHDLKEVMYDPVVSGLRSSLDSRMALEREMYLDKCLAIRDLSLPTIAMVQGHCVAAGVMLAAMCDFIAAADDAVFRDPTLDLGGGGAAAVEVLYHPWEMGVRRAKRFLFLGEPMTAAEALDAGFVSWVFPADQLDERTMALAHQLAARPVRPIRMVKKSMNQMLDRMGQRDSYEYHFLMHQLSHDGERHQPVAEGEEMPLPKSS